MICSPEIFIRAHQDVNRRYYNHSYDRYVKKVGCVGCGKELGEVERYPTWDRKFSFSESEKNNYEFCPYCGHKFNKEELNKVYEKR
jgi:DNA-directed RNA polymerase subunit RPC12/RpoP